MSSAPPRRSSRLAAKAKQDVKASSSAPKAVVKRKAKAAPAKKRARPASPEPDRDEGVNENKSRTRKPRKRVKTCAAVESSGNAEGQSDEVVDAPPDVGSSDEPMVAEASGASHNAAENVDGLALDVVPTEQCAEANVVAESSGTSRDQTGNVEELAGSPMDVVATDERNAEANAGGDSSGSRHDEAGTAEEPADAPLGADSSGSDANWGEYDDSFDLDLAAELEKVSVAVHPPDRIRNALELLIEAPLDVVLEVFSYFEPVDLLQISRTTKTLRSFVLSKEFCISVWQKALRRVNLPPVLDGFNEPQYVALVYDTFCSNCGKDQQSFIMWEVRMRLCKECLDEGTIMGTQDQLRGRQSFGDYDKARELLGITPRYELYRPSHCRLVYYHRSTWERVVDESSTLRRKSPEYGAWLQERRKDHGALVESCEKYEKWTIARDMARTAEMQALLRQRLNNVIARLQPDGWAEELEDPSVLKTLQSHPYVDVAKQLSDQSWATIKPTLTELMANLRIDLRRRKMQVKIAERCRLVEDLGRAYFAKLPETPHNPPPAALAADKPFIDIIKDTPYDEDATPELQAALEIAVPEICEKWRAKQAEELKAMIRKQPGRSDDLSLVVNAFTCSARYRCQYQPPVLHYPHFATHMCFITSRVVGETEVPVWSGRGMETVSDEVYEVCKGIVRMCGLDPATARAEDMDAADVLFRCRHGECVSRHTGGVQLMRWRTAMNHTHPQELVRVDDEELLALGRALERSTLENDLATNCGPRLRFRLTFVCVHCGVTDISRTARAQHLRSVHGIKGEVKTADHYRRSTQYQLTNEESFVVKRAMPGAA